MAPKIPVTVRENTGNLELLHRKIQIILYAKVVNSLKLKIKDIVMFAAIFSIFS